jgi:hypothetical protein
VAGQVGWDETGCFKSTLADQVGQAEVTYARTTKAYWSQFGQSTPRDIVGRDGRGGEGLLGVDGRPIPKAVGQ